jgi:hypothetical protein
MKTQRERKRMKQERILKLIKICPYKKKDTRKRPQIDEQYCDKYNNYCSEVRRGQKCERFTKLLIEEMEKEYK